MKRILTYLSGIAVLLTSGLSGCDGFFGKKTDASFLDVPVYSDKPVAYVPVQPVWKGFVDPVDIIAGYDELIYVADAGTDEIICLDQAGRELGRLPVPGLTSIAQDRSLDILAIGTTDTLGYTLSTIYRFELKNAVYGLATATAEQKIVHPFYFRVSPPANAAEASVRFGGIGLRADNSFFVTRNGPNNSTLQFGGPDNAVLIFNSSGTFISPVMVQTATGIFSDYFRNPGAISTFVQPPQSPLITTSGDFFIAQADNSVALKVQYITVEETDNGVSYSVKNLPTGDTSQASRFLYDAWRFANPCDITVAGDGTGNVFVIDSEKDSLFQFTSGGLEGVKPPAGSTEKKYILCSLGGTGDGLTQFRNPRGVAYLNQTVYVADAGNSRVLRFKLTTDFD